MQTNGEMPPLSSDTDSKGSSHHGRERHSLGSPKLSPEVLSGGNGELSEPTTLNCSLASSEKGSLGGSAEISHTADTGHHSAEMNRHGSSDAEYSSPGFFPPHLSSPSEHAGQISRNAAQETIKKEPRPTSSGGSKAFGSPSRSRRSTAEAIYRVPSCNHGRNSLKGLKSQGADAAHQEQPVKSTKTRRHSNGGTSRSSRNSSIEPIKRGSGSVSDSKRSSVDAAQSKHASTGKTSSKHFQLSEHKKNHSPKSSQEGKDLKKKQSSAEWGPHQKSQSKSALYVNAENEVKARSSTANVSTKSKRKTKKNLELSEEEEQDETSNLVQKPQNPHIHVYLFTDCDREKSCAAEAFPHKTSGTDCRKTLPQQCGWKPGIYNHQQSSGIVTFMAQKSPFSTGCTNQPKGPSTGTLVPSQGQPVLQNQPTSQVVSASGLPRHLPVSLCSGAKSLQDGFDGSGVNPYLLQQPPFERHTDGTLSVPAHSSTLRQPGIHLHIARCSPSQTAQQGGSAACQETQYSRSWAGDTSTTPPEIFFSFLNREKETLTPEFAKSVPGGSNASMSVCCGGFHFTVSDHADPVPRRA